MHGAFFVLEKKDRYTINRPGVALVVQPMQTYALVSNFVTGFEGIPEKNEKLTILKRKVDQMFLNLIFRCCVKVLTS